MPSSRPLAGDARADHTHATTSRDLAGALQKLVQDLSEERREQPRRCLTARQLLAAAQEIRQELASAGAPAPTASLVLVGIVATVTMITGIVFLTFSMPVLFTLVSALRVEQLLELAAVEEDPPALLALVDQDAVALVGAHLAATLRANQNRCVGHLVLLVHDGAASPHRIRCWRGPGGSPSVAATPAVADAR